MQNPSFDRDEPSYAKTILSIVIVTKKYLYLYKLKPIAYGILI